MHTDVIVIGAGAAGLMCAARAGARGKSVRVLDHARALAEKIRISGGGRCNFTNLDIRAERYLSRNPRFCRSALSRYGARDFIALVDRHGIGWHEKTLGQLFCNNSAQQIIDMLVKECERAGVQRLMDCGIEAVRVRDADAAHGGESGFEIVTRRGHFRCKSLVVASGGLSIPKIGATPLGYQLAEQFGIEVVAPRPALVPLALTPEWLQRFGELSGASFDTEARCAGPAFREQALLTHRGLSGPAILQVSSYWQQAGANTSISLDLLPDIDDTAALLAAARQGRHSAQDLLGERLPRRFLRQWLEFEGGQGWLLPLAEQSKASLQTMAQRLKAWRIDPAGTLGWNKAEVTLGGVATEELDQRSMQSRRVPGLYFIGEVVDVTGWLGGYNFQWAWSSAVSAGDSL